MIDVSEVIEDPDVAKEFIVTRRSGNWVNGDFVVAKTQTIKMVGPIQPMKTRDVQMLPQGDTVKGAIHIWSTQPLYVTRLKDEDSGSVSDEVTWQGEAYKILQIDNFSDSGYYHAAAARKLGA